MGVSSIKLGDVVDDAMSHGDIAPVLATGGYSTTPALSIANDVLNAMLLGGPTGSPFNWKWNRFNVPTFPTISYQQDYFVPNVVNVSWLEYAWAVDINNAAMPRPKIDLEVRRDLEVSDVPTTNPDKICWIPASTALTGTWGAAPLGPTSASSSGGTTGTGINGLQNPGPNVIYTNPIGSPNQPTNATTCITDPNGNLWVLTTYGTCGSSQPSWPSTPVYPTPSSPSTVATTVNDGTCVWTAINPNGQAFRLNPIPPQNGITWVISVVAQKRPILFTSLSQTLDPIPDDYSIYFKEGFFAQCYRRSADPKIRARFAEEWSLYLTGLDKALKQGQREMDDFGFYPGVSIMDNGLYIGNVVSPARPFMV